MAFDQTTRNRLNNFVGEARTLLTEEFARQLQSDYGIDPGSGRVDDVAGIVHLDDRQRETARILRDTLHHYTAGKSDKKTRVAAIDRIVREQAFTVLNRLSALRMAEARGLLIPSIVEGVRSDGFQLYQKLAGVALGETDEAYVAYLFSLFDEFAVDLPVLFDRFSPQGRLFPSVHVLRQLLKLLNDEEIAPLWAEDETLGWIYQYFNSSEERRQMRQASQAPRNSRELAVRNQFFTPRYVVEFLTDNTLGRIWYEMVQGETRLVKECRYMVRRPHELFLAPGEEAPLQEPPDDLTQKELLHQTVYIPHRSLKDPRDIKMLDPACGSMHFGLYAFDLFETIYKEAWEMGILGEWADEYRDKTAFLGDVPRLIIKHNIHGIDIDARAVQIAGLSLWLRAQRSWQTQGVPAADRPAITRSNVVVAEPMPGDVVELEAFLATQFNGMAQDHIVAGLVRRVFEAMKLAGEAGSLLKIEEEIAGDIAAAKEKWTAKPKVQQGSLFERPQQGSLPVDVTPVSDEQFWEQVEKRIYSALEKFAEQAIQGESFRRHLFANDAARGFALIDLCRQRYSVILMNPPFGKPVSRVLRKLKMDYEQNWKDIYACFFERAWSLTDSAGFVGAITSSLFLYSKQLKQLRAEMLNIPRLDILVELGSGVLDSATVDTVLTVQRDQASGIGLFIDATDALEKRTGILERIQGDVSLRVAPLEVFSKLENSPISYHLDPILLALWSRGNTLEPRIANVVAGNHTFDDGRFVRLQFEIPRASFHDQWKPYEKGGSFQPFVAPTCLATLWAHDGAEMRANQIMRYGTDAQVIQSSSWWFEPGITYPRISSIGFSPRALPANQMFSEKGMCIFPKADCMSLLGLLASSWTEELLVAFGRHRAYENSAVANLPFGKENVTRTLSALAEEASLIMMTAETLTETSPYFQLPFLEKSRISKNSIFNDSWHEQLRTSLSSIFQELDSVVRDILQLGAASGVDPDNRRSTLVSKINILQDDSPQGLVALVSQYVLGALVGRWDIRYATGEKESPPLPDPFEPLPACPPGMLKNTTGMPAAREHVPDDYPLRISWPGILVGDDGHPEDIVDRVREAMHVIWGEKADDIEVEACVLLGVNNLRDYFGNPNRFFDDHLSRYSKSRRYAPIYWPLTTLEGNYTLWLYYHRLDAGTIYLCVNDFVDPKLAGVQHQLSGLRNRNRDRDDERELERLTNLALELETFRKDLLQIASFWRPNLNDGVEITAAPLYALFGNRKWRSRLEGTWDKLQEGEYDWAHLAMSIWPSRVVPKCVEDRSLAIAHDIEKLFWVEEEERWRRLRAPAEEEARQVDIRRSEERDRLRDLFADLAASEGQHLPAMQVWQSLAEGEWDHRPLGLHLYPERAAAAAFDDATNVFHNLTGPGQKLLQKDTKKNKRLLTKRLTERGSPELVAAVEAVLADEPAAFATLWQALESGERDDLPLALALWPERVVGKALNDADLAAQHGLFDFFWYDEPGAGVRRRRPIDREIAHEVERRGGDRL